MTISYLYVYVLEEGDMQKGGFQRMHGVRRVGILTIETRGESSLITQEVRLVYN